MVPLDSLQHFYFIGVAGSGMSAIAQYLAATGKRVSGSDRFFTAGSNLPIQQQLEAAGIRCHPQDGSGMKAQIDAVVVSTAIEPTVVEVQLAMQRGILILRRSELLAMITRTRKTIAVGGTSGKSTTSGMLYSILSAAGRNPGIISGAGLVSFIRQGKIGNAEAGNPDGWLIIEADESDGSIVQYQPEIGLLLNVDKDHQELHELKELFTIFKANTKQEFIVNRSNTMAAELSSGSRFDFSVDDTPAPLQATDFKASGWEITFNIQQVPFTLHAPGRHNMENALAAVACAMATGLSLEETVEGIQAYEGIYRRHQLIGVKNGITVVDDFAHNPVKCASSIRACQGIGKKVIAWFQPHGYGPTRFLKDDFIAEISAALREEDEIWMSEIYYAGGTAVKDISAADLIHGIQAQHKKATFVEDRNQFAAAVRNHLQPGDILLLMGARDPTLETFATEVFNNI